MGTFRLSWAGCVAVMVAVAVSFGVVMVLSGCDGFSGFGFTMSGSTMLTSSTMSGSSSSGCAIPSGASVPGENGLVVTPDNVTGEVLSLLFATDGQEDEGIVVFGEQRPDIAPTDSDLIAFDFATPSPISSTIMLQPNFVGGQSSLMVLLFGYMDMHFTLNGGSEVVRVALADVDGMQRGDKLLLDAATNTYQWYDLDASEFISTRPTNPAAIAEIANFTDSIRPNMVFYPVNASLVQPIPLDPTILAASSSMDVVLDFIMTGAITLVGQTNEASVTDTLLITSFDMTQNASDFSETGFEVDATVTLTP